MKLDRVARVIELSMLVIAAVGQSNSVTSVERLRLIIERDRLAAQLNRRELRLFRIWVDQDLSS